MIVSFSVVPIGCSTELRQQVSEIIRVIDGSGLPYRTTAMATEVEGTWEEVMPVVKAAHEAGRTFTGRVLTHIAIDDREGAAGRLEGKVREVEEILGKKLERKP